MCCFVSHFFSITVLAYGFSSVFSYLLLHNKLLQSLVALHNNFFIKISGGRESLVLLDGQPGWPPFDNFTEATGSASKMAF